MEVSGHLKASTALFQKKKTSLFPFDRSKFGMDVVA